MKTRKRRCVAFRKVLAAGLVSLAALLLPAPCQGQGYTISTAAGGNPLSFGNSPYLYVPIIGDGAAATAAYLNSPTGVAAGIAGDFYIADTGNNLIRRVAANGMISTVAGSSSLLAGFSGDGGPATSAFLNGPTGVAVDKAGNVYIADRLNNRVRKIDTNGVISTVAGSANAFNPGVVGDGGPATSASLSGPWSVALDSSGNLYIADRDNARVRKVDSSGVITTVAGNGSSVLSTTAATATSTGVIPYGIAFDNSGNLYIADRAYIREVKNGTISNIAGNGKNGYSGDTDAATSAELNQPQGVAVDNAGNIFIADTGNQVIRRVNSQGVIGTIAGSGSVGSYGDGGPADAATFDSPACVAMGSNGTIYVANAPASSYSDSRVRLLTPTSGAAPTISTNGVVPLFSSSITITPGEWISIFGSSFAAGTTAWNGNFPTSLGNTAVTIDTYPAYLSYVSPTQINAQVPNAVSTGAVEVVVTNPGGSSSLELSVGQYSPSFCLFSAKYAAAIVLTPGSPGNSGNGYDLIGPVGAFSFPTRPVATGETLILYGVGFGPTDPVVPSGIAWSGSAPMINTPGLSIGDVPAVVTYAGMVETGLYQISVVVPKTGSGDMLLQVSANGFRAQQSIFVPVQ